MFFSYVPKPIPFALVRRNVGRLYLLFEKKSTDHNLALVSNDRELLGFRVLLFLVWLIFILCSFYFLFIIPTKPVVSNHSNLNSTIIALELIGNVEDYNNLLRVVDNTKYQFYSDSFLKSIDVDNFYIFIYSFYFLILFEIGFRSNSFSQKLPFVFYSLLLFCIIFDLSENYKISTVLNAKSFLYITSQRNQ